MKQNSAANTKTPWTVLFAVAVSACGGITHFEDTTPIVLGSPVPPQPEAPARVEVTKDRIEIKEKIQFAFDKSDILPGSDSLLNEVVAALQAHNEIKKVVINGHTDSEGNDAHNQDLSERRAKAVEGWLVTHGVVPERLQSKGFGESKPIADNNTPEGRERNRRVEFLIVEMEDAK